MTIIMGMTKALESHWSPMSLSSSVCVGGEMIIGAAAPRGPMGVMENHSAYAIEIKAFELHMGQQS